MKKYDTIIFDFDGVIGNSFDYIVYIIYNNVKLHTKCNLTKKQIAKQIREESIFEILKQYHIPKLLVPFITIKIRRDLSKRIHHTKPFNGVIEQIENLQNTHTLYILTSNSMSNISIFLTNYQIKDKFRAIITSSSYLDKSKSINKLLRKQGIDKHKALYVGDEVRDIVACQKIGIDIAVVSYGFNSKRLLKEYNPTFIIDSIEEIENLEDKQ